MITYILVLFIDLGEMLGHDRHQTLHIAGIQTLQECAENGDGLKYFAYDKHIDLTYTCLKLIDHSE